MCFFKFKANIWSFCLNGPSTGKPVWEVIHWCATNFIPVYPFKVMKLWNDAPGFCPQMALFWKLPECIGELPGVSSIWEGIS